MGIFNCVPPPDLMPSPLQNRLSFSRSRFNASEGAGTAIVTLTRTQGTSSEVSVYVSTQDGCYSDSSCDNATAYLDYTPLLSKQVIFHDGESEKAVQIEILQDVSVLLKMIHSICDHGHPCHTCRYFMIATNPTRELTSFPLGIQHFALLGHTRVS